MYPKCAIQVHVPEKADTGTWTNIFNSGNCGEPPSKGVKVLSLDLIRTLKAALVADLAALVADLAALVVDLAGVDQYL